MPESLIWQGVTNLSLADIDLDELRNRVLEASDKDREVLKRFRAHARRLADAIKPIRPYQGNAVSFVASDGGDNRLGFNPAVVELVRVVDSRGNQCAMDAVSSNLSLADLEKRAQTGTSTVAPLQRMCAALGKNLYELSYLIRSAGQPGKSKGALRCYRDIVEWAVLFDLICNPAVQWGGDTIIVRDGLLRTKSFTRSVFPEIDRAIRAGIEVHRRRNVQLSLVGVAKQSAVLSRLALALELEGVFHRDYPCYVEVPEDIEAECYNFDRTWLDTYESTGSGAENEQYQSMGRLFLVKFGDQSQDPVWPVDLAVWQKHDAARILGLLTRDAQQGFPIPDYPMCLQRAHDFAKLTGLEMDVLQDLVYEGMAQGLTDDEKERLLRMQYLGRNLQALRYREG